MLNVDGNTVYELNNSGVNRWSANIQPGKDNNGERVSEEELCEVAAALSTFPELCSSLEWAMRFVEQVRLENPLPEGSGEDVAYQNAIATLTKLRGEG